MTVVIYTVSYALFLLRRNDPAQRSQILQPMVISSLFSWSFLGASLLLCAALLGQYEEFPDLTIREVFGGALLASLGFASIMSLIVREHAFRRMLERTTSLVGLPGVAAGFMSLASRMGLPGVSFREATLGSAFSLSLSGREVVAISPELAKSLSPDETEAVLAHELSHIKNGDSAAKGLARLAGIAFRFDPILRLVEAAVHRERELWADRVAVRFTGKPLALASALVKANSRSVTGQFSHAVGLFVGGRGGGLLSFYPNLEKRIDALIDLARQMEPLDGSMLLAS